MRLIDADVLVNMQMFDPEHEEHYTERMTIEECLDSFTDEGCPPTIEPMQWTPVPEGLPKEYGNYLITTYDGDVDIGTIDPNRKNVWSACDADGFYWLRNVIAWMPLPKPWKGADDES